MSGYVVRLTRLEREKLADAILNYGNARGMAALQSPPPDAAEQVDAARDVWLAALYPDGEAAERRSA